MVYKKDVVGLIVKKAMAQKRITKPEKEVEKIVSDLFDMIDFFNSMPEDDFSALLRPIEDFKVPNEFKDFVMPDSIRFDQNTYACPDLMDRPEVRTLPYGYFAWNVLCDDWRSLFKKDCSNDMTPLSELKKKVVLNDIINKVASKEHRCRSLDNPYIPYYLNVDITGVVGSKYLNYNDNDMIEDYITNLKFN